MCKARIDTNLDLPLCVKLGIDTNLDLPLCVKLGLTQT